MCEFPKTCGKMQLCNDKELFHEGFFVEKKCQDTGVAVVSFGGGDFIYKLYMGRLNIP